MSVQKREGGHRRRNHEVLRGALRLTMACEGPRKGMKVDLGDESGFQTRLYGGLWLRGWISASIFTGGSLFEGVTGGGRGSGGGERGRGGSGTAPPEWIGDRRQMYLQSLSSVVMTYQ